MAIMPLYRYTATDPEPIARSVSPLSRYVSGICASTTVLERYARPIPA